MVYRYGGRVFSLEPRFDGDFWYVGVYEEVDGAQRLRFEYKLNTPKDEASACERAWEIFRARRLGGGQQV